MLNESTRKARLGRTRDAGMTLPELLIVVSVMGLIATVVAAAITVSFRTVTSTEGRVNVARAEQSIDTWLPADLASTDVSDTTLPAVDTDPLASPCGAAVCDGISMDGVNALQLAWKSVIPGPPPTDVITRVQYQYIKVGAEWQLQRVQCEDGGGCTMRVVLHDLTPPLDEPAYLASPTAPTWVLGVSIPNDPATLGLSDNARRILVTIDGGGGSAGAGGGTNNVSLTAGGTTTSEIAADDFTVPSFVRAKSRCGGPVTLIVDDSGSIGSAVESVVEPGVEDFIEAFRGTPTQLQIIPFSSRAHFMNGDNDPANDAPGWHRYVDMTDDAAVTALKDEVEDEFDSSGGTNWEDAFFRAFHNEDGTVANTFPNRIVFFTDGVVTRDRTVGGNYITGPLVHYNAGPYDRGAGWDDSSGHSFSQESWDRTDAMIEYFGRGGMDMIFVGVGPNLQVDLAPDPHADHDPLGEWIQNPQAYTNPSAPPGPVVPMKGSDTIARLLVGAPSGQVEAIYDPVAGEFTNSETADFYNLDSFNATSFGAAMKAAALKDCGGTLTIQTRLTDGTSVPDEFVYENSEYRDDTGAVVPADTRRVSTSATFRTGTFDFEIPSSSAFFMVDVVPQELETLTGFTFQGWSCKAGGVAKTGSDIDSIDVVDSDYEGVTVSVYPNEAVSCIMTVSQP